MSSLTNATGLLIGVVSLSARFQWAFTPKNTTFSIVFYHIRANIQIEINKKMQNHIFRPEIFFWETRCKNKHAKSM